MSAGTCTQCKVTHSLYRSYSFNLVACTEHPYKETCGKVRNRSRRRAATSASGTDCACAARCARRCSWRSGGVRPHRAQNNTHNRACFAGKADAPAAQQPHARASMATAKEQIVDPRIARQTTGMRAKARQLTGSMNDTSSAIGTGRHMVWVSDEAKKKKACTSV